jgi:hypothetical protein
VRMVRRLARLAAWVTVAGAACGVFVWASRFAPIPMRWSDLSGWLRDVERDDAFVEVARWLGVALSGYVFTSAVLALCAEVAAAARWVSLARMFARIGRLSAVPVLRQRLWRSVSTVALSASTVVIAAPTVVAGGGLDVPAELTVDGPISVGDAFEVPDGLVGPFSGFGMADPDARSGRMSEVTAPDDVERRVVDGDTVWDMAEVVYGHVDA